MPTERPTESTEGVAYRYEVSHPGCETLGRGPVDFRRLSKHLVRHFYIRGRKFAEDLATEQRGRVYLLHAGGLVHAIWEHKTTGWLEDHDARALARELVAQLPSATALAHKGSESINAMIRSDTAIELDVGDRFTALWTEIIELAILPRDHQSPTPYAKTLMQRRVYLERRYHQNAECCDAPVLAEGVSPENWTDELLARSELPDGQSCRGVSNAISRGRDVWVVLVQKHGRLPISVRVPKDDAATLNEFWTLTGPVWKCASCTREHFLDPPQFVRRGNQFHLASEPPCAFTATGR